MKTRDPILKRDETRGESAPRYFDIEAIGLSLREVGTDVLRGEATDFVSRWFYSKDAEADLVIWTDGEKRIIKSQLCYFGQVVEWNPIHGTRTGCVVEEELNGKALEESETSEMILYDRSVQASGVGHAVAILACVPELGNEIRAKLIHNLRDSNRLHKSARERALKVWAPKIDEIVSAKPPGFWKRLRSWVLGG